MTLAEFRRKHSLPPRWRPSKLWPIVKRLILENHSILIEEDIRNSYYILRDLLNPLIGTELDLDEFNWFLTTQGYSSYRDDVWTSIEQKEGMKRPSAKPEGWYYQFRTKHPIEDMYLAWDQFRGWIFVEKSGIAEKLAPLSSEGWAIVCSGRGFPTRLVRRLLKEEGKPILIFHDADIEGKLIYEVFGDGSRRTTHLDLLIEKSTDIGLDWEDVVTLDLPTQPEPPKHKGRPRAEISALSVLKVRMGIDNPTLDYIKVKMVQNCITIAPLEISKWELWRSSARMEIESLIEQLLQDDIDELIGDIDIEDGEAVYARFKQEDDDGHYFDTEEIVMVLRDAIHDLKERLFWRYAQEIHDDNVKRTNDELATMLGVDSDSMQGNE